MRHKDTLSPRAGRSSPRRCENRRIPGPVAAALSGSGTTGRRATSVTNLRTSTFARAAAAPASVRVCASSGAAAMPSLGQLRFAAGRKPGFEYLLVDLRVELQPE